MTQNNTEIRKTATNNGVFLWEIAEVLGMTDSSFSRKLRHELNEQEKAKVLNVIAEISQKNKPL